MTRAEAIEQAVRNVLGPDRIAAYRQVIPGDHWVPAPWLAAMVFEEPIRTEFRRITGSAPLAPVAGKANAWALFDDK